jgi:hypothetical protein
MLCLINDEEVKPGECSVVAKSFAASTAVVAAPKEEFFIQKRVRQNALRILGRPFTVEACFTNAVDQFVSGTTSVKWWISG